MLMCDKFYFMTGCIISFCLGLITLGDEVSYLLREAFKKKPLNL